MTSRKNQLLISIQKNNMLSESEKVKFFMEINKPRPLKVRNYTPATQVFEPTPVIPLTPMDVKQRLSPDEWILYKEKYNEVVTSFIGKISNWFIKATLLATPVVAGFLEVLPFINRVRELMSLRARYTDLHHGPDGYYRSEFQRSWFRYRIPDQNNPNEAENYNLESLARMIRGDPSLSVWLVNTYGEGFAEIIIDMADRLIF